MVGMPFIGWLCATTGHELDGSMARIRALAERAERVAAEQAEARRKAAEWAAAAEVAADRQQQSVEMPDVERPSVEQPFVAWPEEWLDVPEESRPLHDWHPMVLAHRGPPVQHTHRPSLSDPLPQWDGQLMPIERLMNGEVCSVSPPVSDLGA